ncbi:hypothetical protein N0V84_007243 [Fusarium piperis]|uniref:BZIP domain-containing protein n=1 Tax=Fusarium piperis TaxID=1435070 RepID=A0A9W8WAC3_9HYPO|nr:hypothetical protein N0V84_007243 [Fusarium piperis]
MGDTAMSASANQQPSWGQWWSADAFTLPVSFEGPDAVQSYCPQGDVQYSDFSPSQSIGFSPDWAKFSNTHEYPVPPSISESPLPEQSPSASESRRGSVSTLPDKKKRRRSTAKRTTAKSPGRGSNRKNKSQATAEEWPQESKSRRAQYTNTDGSASSEQVGDKYSRLVQERNRVASNKFRIKKREDAKRLKADEEDMERINRDLSSCVADLTLEVYQLKIRLLQHTDCDCALIQSYISNEAQRYIQDLDDENHPGHKC